MDKQIALHIDQSQQRYVHLRNHLTPISVELHKAPNIQSAIEMLQKNMYRLVIIHFGTVSQKAYELCSFIHSINNHTIIIILMHETRISIEEKLFDYGVNDVVTGKQTYSRLLCKRIRTHLLYNYVLPAIKNKMIILNDTFIDFDRREVRCNGVIRELPGILADLLKYFLDNPNRIISRKELLESPIWADSICTPPEEGGKTFDVNIGKLRKIIESDPTQPQIIKSVRGIGWKLAKDVVE